jgi:tetratricopeptide (TPR) repeat protein
MRIARTLIMMAALLVAGCGADAEKVREHVAKGKALMAQGKPDLAVDEFSKATAVDKNSMEAWFELGNAYAALKKHDVALAAYVAAKRLDRHSVAPYLAHAKVQIELGHIAEATTELNLVVEMDPKNLDGLIQLGRVSQMPQKLPDGTTGVSAASLERAELNLQAATTLAPRSAAAYFELAKVSAKLGKREQARAALAALRSLAETDPAAKKLLPEAEQALKAFRG